MIFESGVVTESIARDAQILRYCNVAAEAFLVWDMLIHLSDEVELIWKSRNTWVKWMYLYLRHYSILSLGILILQGSNSVHFTPKTCRNWFIAESIISNSIVLVTEVVLLVRVWAIYGKSRIVLCILGTASLAEGVTVVTTTVKAFASARVALDQGCILVYIPPVLTAAWAASLAFQTLIFGLTVARWVTHLTTTKQLGRRSVMYVFARDGGWAYGIMVVVFLVNLLTFRLEASPLASAFFRWALSMASFTGSHVLLNLRRLGSQLQDGFSSPPGLESRTELGDLVFAPHGFHRTATQTMPTLIGPEVLRSDPEDYDADEFSA